MSIDARLEELGITLPPPPKPGGVYKPVVIVGSTAYVSGHGPLLDDGTMLSGKVGVDVDLAGGQASARQTGLAMLSTLKSQLGSLDRIKRFIKVLGMVNCAPDFTQHPQVINGFSELMRDIFGEDSGVAARSAVGMGSLPSNITTEIEAILEIG